MATLDDKLMGEKLHYYCSSSEDEEEPPIERPPEATEGRATGGGSCNTGPKGVVKDFMRFRQLETERREERDREKTELAKKLSLTCRSTEEDKKRDDLDAELEAMIDDEFMKAYMSKRMKEMELSAESRKIFGTVSELDDGGSFLRAVESEPNSVSVIVYVHEPGREECEAMDGCVKILAEERPFVKFARIAASAVGFSKHFKTRGVPALLVYKGGDLVASFPRLTDSLGRDFYATDVEEFLVENGVLRDRTLEPSVIRSGGTQDDDSE